MGSPLVTPIQTLWRGKLPKEITHRGVDGQEIPAAVPYFTWPVVFEAMDAGRYTLHPVDRKSPFFARH
jgi:hypothetical protein